MKIFLYLFHQKRCRDRWIFETYYLTIKLPPCLTLTNRISDLELENIWGYFVHIACEYLPIQTLVAVDPLFVSSILRMQSFISKLGPSLAI